MTVNDHERWPKIAQVSPNFHVFCPNDLEDEGQFHPYLIGVESYILCKFSEIPCNTFLLMMRTRPKWPDFECFKAK